MKQTILLISLTLVFYLNDYLFIYLKSPLVILFADYFLRFIVIGILLKYSKAPYSENLGLKKINPVLIIFYSLIILSIGYYLFSNFRPQLELKIPGTQSLLFSPLNNSFLKVLDLSLGLVLISFSEELLFRGFYTKVLEKWNVNIMIVFSSLVFALAFWGLGLPYIIVAFIFGLIIHMIRIVSKSIYPCLLGHFLLNFFLLF